MFQTVLGLNKILSEELIHSHIGETAFGSGGGYLVQWL